MPDDLKLIYCPFPSQDAARAVAKQMVEQHLVACCTILPQSESHYYWQGAYQITSEVILLAKTTAEKLLGAVYLLEAHHPYDCPAILTFTASANPDFVHWVQAQLKD